MTSGPERAANRLSRYFVPWSRVVAGLFLVGALLPVAVAFSTYRDSRVGDGEAAGQGVVVNNRSQTDDSGADRGSVDYFAVIEYTVDGQTYQVEDRSASSEPARLGETYDIVYATDNPATSRVIFPGAWRFAIGFAVVTVGLGLFILWAAPRWVRRYNSTRR